MAPLLRFALLALALLVSAAIVAAHGVRGIGLLVGLALLATLPRSRAWMTGERWLVRLTGSRRRAAAIAMFFVIGALVAVNVYEAVH